MAKKPVKKPPAPVVAEAQETEVEKNYNAKRKAGTTGALPDSYFNWDAALCPMPKTPNSCPVVLSLSDEGQTPGKNIYRYMGILFKDENNLGLREGNAEVRLLINTSFLENSTNLVYAALCFFKWDGANFRRTSLHPAGHKDLEYVMIGSIADFEARCQKSYKQHLLGRILQIKRELAGSKGGLTIERIVTLQENLAEYEAKYKAAEKEGTLNTVVTR